MTFLGRPFAQIRLVNGVPAVPRRDVLFLPPQSKPCCRLCHCGRARGRHAQKWEEDVTVLEDFFFWLHLKLHGQSFQRPIYEKPQCQQVRRGLFPVGPVGCRQGGCGAPAALLWAGLAIFGTHLPCFGWFYSIFICFAQWCCDPNGELYGCFD